MYLMRRIERFLQRADMAPTRFGREALRDPCFVGDLRRGREPGAEVAGRVAAFIAAREAELGQ